MGHKNRHQFLAQFFMDFQCSFCSSKPQNQSSHCLWKNFPFWKWFLELTAEIKRATPHARRVWRTVEENGVVSCVKITLFVFLMVGPELNGVSFLKYVQFLPQFSLLFRMVHFFLSPHRKQSKSYVPFCWGSYIKKKQLVILVFAKATDVRRKKVDMYISPN